MQDRDVNDNPFNFDLWTDGTTEVKNMQDVKLKPCPFCGGEAEIFVSDVSDRAVIYCRGCDAQIQIKPNEEEAIEAWNKRVSEVKE